MATSSLARDTAYTRILAFENAMCRRLGRSRMERYARNLEYYSGENLPPDNVEQPLGINYAAQFNQKHAHYLFGQWEKDIVTWRVNALAETDEARERAQRVSEYCQRLARRNEANIVLFEGGLNASIYGDCVLRATWDQDEGRVRWENVLPEFVHFRWHPSDVNKVVEAIVAYPMPREDAYALYGTTGTPVYTSPNMENTMFGFCMYWERWTAERFEIWVDEVKVKDVPNPYSMVDGAGNFYPGVIPLLHIPNARAGGEFYGFADAEPIFLIQDEINRKLADQGDIVNSFAHPITVLNNFYGDVEDLPVGPDQVWDLGREGKAQILQWQGSPPAVMEYVKQLIEIMMDLGSMSPVAFSRHQGTQQSAIALAIDMMPVTEKARWKRMFWASALRKLVRLSAFIEARAGQALPFPFEELVTHDIQVQWAPMLPRDRMLQVNESISRRTNLLQSIERALADLGEEDPSAERDRIINDVEELVSLGLKQQMFAMGSGGSGSSSTPDGVSNSSAKGRPRGSTKQ